MSAEYEAHASRLQKRAKAEHTAWLATLTFEQRKKLRALGVLDAPDDSHEVGGHSPWQAHDMADSSAASIPADLSALDDPTDLLAEELGLPPEVARKILAWHEDRLRDALRSHEADLLGIVVGGLLASNNVRVASAGLAFATNMAAANGLGCQADFARKLGVSRTILSRAVVEWQRTLGMPTSPFQKSEKACRTYSTTGKASHWRTKKVNAIHLAKRLNALFRPQS